METLFIIIFKQLIFWMAWIIIPLIWEIAPAIGGFFILLAKRAKKKEPFVLDKYPDVTIIIPIYNSEMTLSDCLDSVYHSDYPHEMMHIILVDNGEKDDSYDIFADFQKKYHNLSIYWMKSQQGKSKALNMAIFNSEGKYIIHLDSDGKVEKSALKRMVEKFEQNQHIHCMTGTVLIDYGLIEETKDFFMRITRRCEFYEYCQAFLAGRNYEAELKSIYTLSGAFSAFRRSAILKTLMYNSITVCEDTHITFQIRHLLKQDILICEDALFYVDPIEGYNKLYTQRQRWQRGEIEVSHMFLSKDLKPISGFFKNFMVRVLMYDHTFAFPRAIWYFAIIYLLFLNYPISLIIGSLFILYVLYVGAAFLFHIIVRMYLKEYKNMKKYYASKWYVCFLLPLYNFGIFWIRFAGIINSIKADVKWKSSTLTEEWQAFKEQIKKDFKKTAKLLKKIRGVMNNE